MAYLREIVRRRCQAVACKSWATVELCNSYNAVNGYYCRRHGEKECAALFRSEAEDRLRG